MSLFSWPCSHLTNILISLIICLFLLKRQTFFSFLFVFLPLFILIPSFDILFLSDFFTNLMIISNLHVCLFITCISVYSLWHFFFWMNVFCTARISCKYYLETLFKSCNHLAVLFWIPIPKEKKKYIYLTALAIWGELPSSSKGLSFHLFRRFFSFLPRFIISKWERWQLSSAQPWGSVRKNKKDILLATASHVNAHKGVFI